MQNVHIRPVFPGPITYYIHTLILQHNKPWNSKMEIMGSEAYFICLVATLLFQAEL